VRHEVILKENEATGQLQIRNVQDAMYDKQFHPVLSIPIDVLMSHKSRLPRI